MHRNASGKKQEQFHQGQCGFGEARETEACQIHKYPGNLKNICQRKLIVWYHIGTTPFRWIWRIVFP